MPNRYINSKNEVACVNVPVIQILQPLETSNDPSSVFHKYLLHETDELVLGEEGELEEQMLKEG